MELLVRSYVSKLLQFGVFYSAVLVGVICHQGQAHPRHLSTALYRDRLGAPKDTAENAAKVQPLMIPAIYRCNEMIGCDKNYSLFISGYWALCSRPSPSLPAVHSDG